MAYVSKEQIEKARQIDALTYMKLYEPSDLKHIKGNTYQLVSHDSCKFNNGMWYWWSQGIGGRSALDFLTKVRDMEFTEAVTLLTGDEVTRLDIQHASPLYAKKERKELEIPDRADNQERLYEYLCGTRGISRHIVQELADRGQIYLTRDKNNCAFVGKDFDGNIKMITLRGTVGSFKNTAEGSDRNYPFSVISADYGTKNSVVHFFEAPIDLLSYATIMGDVGIDYKTQNMIANCGIAKYNEKDQELKLPMALKTYLDNFQTKTVCLHLDTDEPGIKAAEYIKKVLCIKGYNVMNQPPPKGYKDCNDFLLKSERLTAERKRGHEERQTL